jgi:hypothetical protein
MAASLVPALKTQVDTAGVVRLKAGDIAFKPKLQETTRKMSLSFLSTESGRVRLASNIRESPRCSAQRECFGSFGRSSVPTTAPIVGVDRSPSASQTVSKSSQPKL